MESVAGAPSCLCGLRPPLAANLKVRLLVHAHVCDNQLRLPFVARGLPYGIPVHSHCLESGVSCRPKPSHLLCCRVPCACSSPPHAVRQCSHLRVMPDYFPLHSLSPLCLASSPGLCFQPIRTLLCLQPASCPCAARYGYSCRSLCAWCTATDKIAQMQAACTPASASAARTRVRSARCSCTEPGHAGSSAWARRWKPGPRRRTV